MALRYYYYYYLYPIHHHRYYYYYLSLLLWGHHLLCLFSSAAATPTAGHLAAIYPFSYYPIKVTSPPTPPFLLSPTFLGLTPVWCCSPPC